MDNSLKDRVLETVDIVEVVGERVALTRKGKDYIGLCPFHPDHKPSFAVSPTKRIFKCWSCGAGGDVIRFVEKFERIDFRTALAQLARRAGIELRSTPEDRQAAQIRGELLAAIAWARDHFRRALGAPGAGQRAREYALSRGLTEATIERFGIGYAADSWDDLVTSARRAGLRPEIISQAGLTATNENGRTYDRFRHRLIFPIADAAGRPIAFGGRALDDDPAKYLNSPESPLFSKSRVLYGLDLARRAIQKQDAAIIVEGYMDAVLLAQHGFENVVATLGTAMTEAHAKLLRPLAGTLYLCFDSDDAGVRAANRAVEVSVLTKTQVRVVVLDGFKDPADCLVAQGAEGFAAQLKRSVDALEFKWSKAVSAYDRGDQRSRRAAIEEFVQFVAGVAVAGGVDPFQQDLLVGRLSSLLGLPPEEVFDLLGRAKRLIQRRGRAERTVVAAASDYAGAIRGLAGGLVVAVESVLGLLLEGGECWRHVDETVARGVACSETWQRLYGLLLEVHDDMGEYSIGDIVARCDDSAMCELVERARARGAGSELGAAAFLAARERLAAELGVLRRTDLRADLCGPGGDDESVFRRLHAEARGTDTILPPERRHGPLPVTP
ncbi:MAG TPA: DNA primase [Phycisphaerae bacterium]|nr:DNA primase [Phycisphaerae bacterium]